MIFERSRTTRARVEDDARLRGRERERHARERERDGSRREEKENRGTRERGRTELVVIGVTKTCLIYWEKRGTEKWRKYGHETNKQSRMAIPMD